MKNRGLTWRIPPGVNKCQTDSSRIKMRPCLFLPFVQFLHSSKPITQAPPSLLGNSLEVLKLIMSGWKWETIALSKPAFDAFDLFPCSKKKKKRRACKVYNWEDSPFLQLRVLSSSEIVLLSPKLFCSKTYLVYYFPAATTVCLIWIVVLKQGSHRISEFDMKRFEK